MLVTDVLAVRYFKHRETNEDTPIEIILTGTDLDNETLSFSVTVEPENGIYAEGIYTPDENWFGTDTFSYIANDGIDDSEPAMVTIIVNSVDDDIVIDELLPAEFTQVIDETETINFSITAIDPDGNDLEYHWNLDDTEVSTTDSYEFITDWQSAGDYVVTLNVTDNFEVTENTLEFTWDVHVNDTGDTVPNILPLITQLDQIYPNPFNPQTTIDYELANDGWVNIEVYNIRGKKIVVLADEAKNAGRYSLNWNAESYSSGIYFIRLSTSTYTEVKKAILLK